MTIALMPRQGPRSNHVQMNGDRGRKIARSLADSVLSRAEKLLRNFLSHPGNKKPALRRVNNNPTAIIRGRSHQPYGTSGRLHARCEISKTRPCVKTERDEARSKQDLAIAG
jgi:hypothetical protein